MLVWLDGGMDISREQLIDLCVDDATRFLDSLDII